MFADLINNELDPNPFSNIIVDHIKNKLFDSDNVITHFEDYVNRCSVWSDQTVDEHVAYLKKLVKAGGGFVCIGMFFVLSFQIFLENLK